MIIKRNSRMIVNIKDRRLCEEGKEQKVKVANYRFAYKSSALIAGAVTSIMFILTCSQFKIEHPVKYLALMMFLIGVDLLFLGRCAGMQKHLKTSVARFNKNFNKYRK